MIRAYLTQLLGKLLCNFFGHLRRELISSVPYQDAPGYLYCRYECKRCGNIVARKMKVKP